MRNFLIFEKIWFETIFLLKKIDSGIICEFTKLLFETLLLKALYVAYLVVFKYAL